MERLTIRNSDGTVSQPTNTTVEQVFYRLAEYEDTGVVPDELREIQNEAYDLGYQSCLNDKGMKWTEAEELQRYRKTGLKPEQISNAKEEGRLVVLPCRVGDTVYIAGHRFPAQIDEIVMDAVNGTTFNWSEYERWSEGEELWDDGWFTQEDMGKTVFLTIEEAAAIVKEADDD